MKIHVFSVVIVASLIFSVLTTPLSAQINTKTDVSETPVEECVDGMWELFDGKILSGLSLMEKNFVVLQSTPNILDTVEEENQFWVGGCGIALGVARLLMGNLDGALEALVFAEENFAAENALQWQLNSLYLIGSIYMTQGEKDKAIEQLDKASNLVAEMDALCPPTIELLINGALENNKAAAIFTWGGIHPNERDNELLLKTRNHLTSSLGYFNDLETQKCAELLNNSFGSLQRSQNFSGFLNDLNKQLLENLTEDNQSQENPFEGFLEGLDPTNHDLTSCDNSIPGLMLQPILCAAGQTIKPLILNNLGETYRVVGENDKAKPYYDQALSSLQHVDEQHSLFLMINPFSQAVEGIVKNNLGLSYYQEGDNQQALTYFEDAWKLLEPLNNRPFMATLLTNQGFINQQLGRHEQALEDYVQAMDIAETLRSTADSGLTKIVFSGGLEDKQNHYSLNGSLINYTDVYSYATDLYYQQGQYEDAFYTSERGRSRLFLELLTTNQLHLTDIQAANLLAQERDLYAKRQLIRDILEQTDSFITPKHERFLYTTSKKHNLNIDLKTVEISYTHVLTAVQNQKPELMALISGQGDILDVTQLQPFLTSDETVLSYFVLDDKTLAFIITKDDFQTAVLDVSQTELRELVGAFRSFLNISDSQAPPPESAPVLYDRLIRPIQNKLTTHHLTIIPHNVLHYLPFSALTDGESYLIDEYAITLLPSASVLPYIERNIPDEIYPPLVIGNPSSDLASASDEAKRIADLYGVDPLIGNQATELMVRKHLTQTGILHLAAHGKYDDTDPLNSTIYLVGDNTQRTLNDGLLQVREIFSLDLHQTDLVVLSACETQMGKLTVANTVAPGDELTSLTRSFFFAGAPTVVATLWLVDDEATGRLMEQFHINLRKGMSKAEGLRQAQLSVRKDYPNPYYWATFTLSGNGR